MSTIAAALARDECNYLHVCAVLDAVCNAESFNRRETLLNTRSLGHLSLSNYMPPSKLCYDCTRLFSQLKYAGSNEYKLLEHLFQLS